MIDIVERLRSFRSNTDHGKPDPLHIECADEIERLRDALRGLVDFIEIDKLKMDPLALSIAHRALSVASRERP